MYTIQRISHAPQRISPAPWLYRLLFAVVSLIAGTAPCFAQDAADGALLGTWQGNLSINPTTHLAIQFIVERDAQGKLSAHLNAPNEPNLQNIAVTRTTFSAGKVEFTVDEVNGSYEGTLHDRAIAGKWKQNGAEFDLALAPYVVPKVPAQVAAHLDGPWHGTLNVPNTDMKVPLVINFKKDAGAPSGMSATLDSPNQAAFGMPAEVKLEDNIVSVTVLRPKMAFSGKIEKDQLVGRWLQGGSAAMNFIKGQDETVSLTVDETARKRLAGDWYGEFSNGIGIALRFKQETNGKFLAYLDSPHEGRRGIPLDKVTLDSDHLLLGAGAIRMSFDGKLGADTIAGSFSANGPPQNVVLKRGNYTQQTFRLTQELAQKLSGRWDGKAANTNMTLRFEVSANGEVIGQQDIPNRQMFALPITDLAFDGENLKLTVKGISAEFKGKLVKNEMSGDWTMPSLQFPLTLLRTALK
ncbi:MAG: hypothetical protein JNN30_20755 [Rhodanobacteraceae bacterium]|nr:hypothetical protein [Rhodanobacteraceae bacterium]